MSPWHFLVRVGCSSLSRFSELQIEQRDLLTFTNSSGWERWHSTRTKSECPTTESCSHCLEQHRYIYIYINTFLLSTNPKRPHQWETCYRHVPYRNLQLKHLLNLYSQEVAAFELKRWDGTIFLTAPATSKRHQLLWPYLCGIIRQMKLWIETIKSHPEQLGQGRKKVKWGERTGHVVTAKHSV